MQKEAVYLSSRFIKTVHSARVVYGNNAVCKGGLLKQLGECWQWYAACCPTFQHKYASSKYTIAIFAPNTLTRCERLGILHLPKVFAQIHSLQNNDYFFFAQDQCKESWNVFNLVKMHIKKVDLHAGNTWIQSFK